MRHISSENWPSPLLLLRWSSRRLSDLLKGTEQNGSKGAGDHYSFISPHGLLASEQL